MARGHCADRGESLVVFARTHGVERFALLLGRIRVKISGFDGWVVVGLLFLCNRQGRDMKECCLKAVQKSAVKMPKIAFKTKAYKTSPFLLFLVLEKLISLFANGWPRVHP
jgi:hypothetical protein